MDISAEQAIKKVLEQWWGRLIEIIDLQIVPKIVNIIGCLFQFTTLNLWVFRNFFHSFFIMTV